MTSSATKRVPTESLLRRAAHVAHHYGFLPLDGKGSAKATCSLNQLPQQLEREFAKTYGEFLPIMEGTEPRLFYRIRPGSDSKPTLFSLHIFGAPQSIAEAVLIKTAVDILEDLSVENAEVFINGIGDRDSVARFSRELTLYLRKYLDVMPAPAREAMKKDVLMAYTELVRREHEICEGAPSAMQYLTEPARVHLRSLLETLDNVGIVYEFDPHIIGHRDCFNKTLFEIRSTDPEAPKVYARGGRYDELGKRIFRSSLPAAGIVLEFETTGKKIPEKIAYRGGKPKVCFIQLGLEAKMRSLLVLDELRRARIPLYQTLYHERLTEQLETAESLKVPFTIIMGYREALAGAVIVRNMETRAQETVSINSLGTYLKSL